MMTLPAANHPALSAADAALMRQLAAEAHELMSDTAADRLVARIVVALNTGVIDTQTKGTLSVICDR